MTARWRARAACREADPDVFFPTATSGPAFEAQVALAKAVCAGCPVRVQCLAEALERLPCGIAGGLTEDERRRLRGGPMADPAQRQISEGLKLLAAGRPLREVARRCEVTERTVQGWAARSAPGSRAAS